jgi:general secretion pathway protein D
MASSLVTAIGNGGISANTASGFSPATAFLNADGVHAVLSFLNTENDTEVVATPRAVTADNLEAKLSVTRAYPIFQVTPGSANVAAAAQVQYTNLGTILNVTPSIRANNNIALRVIPEVSNIDSKDQQIINGAVNQANVYAIRKIEANVVVPSGHTLVMGGLISDSSTKSFTKVPVLGDLPGVGILFRKDAKSRNKVNLLIFVTPTIIQEQDFSPAPTTFLRTTIPQRPDKEESAWDSGKPYDWNRPVQK